MLKHFECVHGGSMDVICFLGRLSAFVLHSNNKWRWFLWKIAA